MWTLLWAVAITPPSDGTPRTPATLGPIDLDGDRQRETVLQTDAGVVVGRTTVPCGTTAAPCQVEVHDILMVDRTRELLLCERDGDTRSCRLFRMRDKSLREIKLTVAPPARSAYPSGRLRAPAISTKGDGTLVAHMPGGWCPRTEAFTWDGERLVHAASPTWTCSEVESTATASRALSNAPEGAPIGVSLAAGQTVRVLAESVALPGWLLVRLDGGEHGWIDAEGVLPAPEWTPPTPALAPPPLR